MIKNIKLINNTQNKTGGLMCVSALVLIKKDKMRQKNKEDR